MKIQISQRLNNISNYAFADIDNKVDGLKKLGIKAIDFGVGDPKEPTPGIVRNIIKKAVDARKSSGYPSYIGREEYRREISKWIKKKFNISLDYVIIPNPGYPPYERGTLFAEGKPYFLSLLRKNNFLMDLSKIPREIAKKSKLLWINYPSNPTGVLASKEFLKEVIDFGHDNNIIIASDECYSEIYFNEKPHSILEYSEEGVVAFQSLSKRSAMTGYRVGWIAGDGEIIAAFRKL